MPRLLIEDLRVMYGRIVGTAGISLELDRGETLALVGANGAGKSSTLKAILNMVDYPEGRITLDGADLKGRKASDMVRLGIGYSPEGRRVFPQLSVLENLHVGGMITPAREVPGLVEKMFGYFPRLKERARQRAGSLSGGEQQMLAIARALMSKPKILMLDEPSLGLAPVIVERIGEILQEVQRAEALAVLLAEQNAMWALSLARRAVILELGKVAMTGEAAALLADPSVQRAYLGIS